MTDATIDLDTLLASIDPERPTGVHPRGDPATAEAYHTTFKDPLGEARAADRRALAADAELPRLQSQLDQAASAWGPVRDGAAKLLRESTKDTEVAAGLAQALVRLHGFAGLRDAFHLLDGLMGTFGEALHGPLDETDHPAPGDPVARLLENADAPLINHIHRVTLAGDGSGRYALWHQRMTESGDLGARMDAAVAELPSARAGALKADIAAAREAARALDTTFSATFKWTAPTFDPLYDALDQVRGVLDRAAPHAEASPAGGADDTADAGGSAPATTASVPASSPGRIDSREEAFRTLQAVADFFRRTEPHSPLPHALDDIVRRGRLSFPDLLRELIPNEDERRQAFTRLGISPERQEPESEP